jgi:hypothetical protein
MVWRERKRSGTSDPFRSDVAKGEMTPRDKTVWEGGWHGKDGKMLFRVKMFQYRRSGGVKQTGCHREDVWSQFGKKCGHNVTVANCPPWGEVDIISMDVPSEV